VTVSYAIEVRDLRAFRDYVRFRTPQGKRVRIATFVLISAVAVLLSTTGTSESIGARVISFVLSFGIMFIFMKVLNWIFVRIAEWRTLTPERQKGLLCDHTITLGEDAIVESTSVDEHKKNWSGVDRVVADSNYIYIFLTPQMAHIIPKRAFPSEESAESFFKRACELHAKAVAA